MKKANMDFGIIEETFEIVIAFDLEGKILFGNKSAREKLSYSEEELKERNMTEIFWQEFQVENQKFAPFDAKKLTEKQETVMYRKNSSCFPVSLRFYFTADQTGFLFPEDSKELLTISTSFRSGANFKRPTDLSGLVVTAFVRQ